MPYKNKEDQKKWRDSHQEYIKSYRKEYRKHNKKMLSEVDRAYYIDNKNKFIERAKKWRINNRERYKAIKANRRSLVKNLTEAVVQLVYEKNIKNNRRLSCYLCLIPISIQDSHLEHKTPLSRGGSNDFTNLEVSCRQCNQRKGAKTLEEYLNLGIVTHANNL